MHCVFKKKVYSYFRLNFATSIFCFHKLAHETGNNNKKRRIMKQIYLMTLFVNTRLLPRFLPNKYD